MKITSLKDLGSALNAKTNGSESIKPVESETTDERVFLGNQLILVDTEKLSMEGKNRFESNIVQVMKTASVCGFEVFTRPNSKKISLTKSKVSDDDYSSKTDIVLIPLGVSSWIAMTTVEETLGMKTSVRNAKYQDFSVTSIIDLLRHFE